MRRSNGRFQSSYGGCDDESAFILRTQQRQIYKHETLLNVRSLNSRAPNPSIRIRDRHNLIGCVACWNVNFRLCPFANRRQYGGDVAGHIRASIEDYGSTYKIVAGRDRCYGVKGPGFGPLERDERSHDAANWQVHHDRDMISFGADRKINQLVRACGIKALKKEALVVDDAPI